jgi:hypothetical protein
VAIADGYAQPLATDAEDDPHVREVGEDRADEKRREGRQILGSGHPDAAMRRRVSGSASAIAACRLGGAIRLGESGM